MIFNGAQDAKGFRHAEFAGGREGAQTTRRPDQSTQERQPEHLRSQISQAVEQADEECQQQIDRSHIEHPDLLVLERHILRGSQPGSPGQHRDQCI